jgi:hypothetical protein
MEKLTENQSGFVERVIRAAKLDTTLYEEVEADTGALGQAMGVVVLASISAGVGSATGGGLGGLVSISLIALAAWYVWAALIYILGTRVFPGPHTEADLGQLLRTIGFASAPGLVRVFGVIPGVGALVFFGAIIWELVAMVVAIRQALDYERIGQAIRVCAVGWLIQLIVIGILLSIVGSPLQPSAG